MVTQSLLCAKALPLRTKYWTAAAYKRVISKQRTAVVVGATSGIGEACAHRLAEQGFLVIAVGRDRPGRAEAVVAALTEASNESVNSLIAAADSTTSTKHSDSAPAHEFYACDAFSLKSVQETAQKIQARHPKIDALVMTQGMATTQGFTPTPGEGNDEKLTLHYYSRMAMLYCLLPALLTKTNSDDGMPAVVVSVLSGGVHSAYKNYSKDPSLKDSYSIKNAADAAGYYNDLGLDQFALDNLKKRQADNNTRELCVVHAAPGFVNTNWGTEFHPVLRSMVRFVQGWGGKAPADCAEFLMGSTVVVAEAGDDLPKRLDNNNSSGIYVVGQYGEPAALTKDHTPEARDFIWKHTKKVLQKAGISIE